MVIVRNTKYQPNFAQSVAGTYLNHLFDIPNMIILT